MRRATETRLKTGLLKKKHVEAHLKFTEEHLDKPVKYWETIVWSDETEIGCSLDAIIHTMLVGGGNMMVRGSFSAYGTGKLPLIEERIIGKVYRDILDKKKKKNLLPSTRMIKMGGLSARH